MIGLLTLPKDIQDKIAEKKITMGHARVLSKLDSEEQQRTLANKIIKEDLSVRQLEDLTKSKEKYERTNKIKTNTKSNEYKYLEDSLSEQLGTKVKVRSNKIEIKFVNNNDLNRLLEIMNININN